MAGTGRKGPLASGRYWPISAGCDRQKSTQRCPSRAADIGQKQPVVTSLNQAAFLQR